VKLLFDEEELWQEELFQAWLTEEPAAA
jgi:hypothetical protein